MIAENNFMDDFDDYKLQELLRPINLFKTDDEIRAFIAIKGDDLELYRRGLEEMLRLCEEDELYEWCQIISEKLKYLK